MCESNKIDLEIYRKALKIKEAKSFSIVPYSLMFRNLRFSQTVFFSFFTVPSWKNWSLQTLIPSRWPTVSWRTTLASGYMQTTAPTIQGKISPKYYCQVCARSPGWLKLFRFCCKTSSWLRCVLNCSIKTSSDSALLANKSTNLNFPVIYIFYCSFTAEELWEKFCI